MENVLSFALSVGEVRLSRKSSSVFVRVADARRGEELTGLQEDYMLHLTANLQGKFLHKLASAPLTTLVPRGVSVDDFQVKLADAFHENSKFERPRNRSEVEL